MSTDNHTGDKQAGHVKDGGPGHIHAAPHATVNAPHDPNHSNSHNQVKVDEKKDSPSAHATAINHTTNVAAAPAAPAPDPEAIDILLVEMAVKKLNTDVNAAQPNMEALKADVAKLNTNVGKLVEKHNTTTKGAHVPNLVAAPAPVAPAAAPVAHAAPTAGATATTHTPVTVNCNPPAHTAPTLNATPTSLVKPHEIVKAPTSPAHSPMGA